MLIDQNSRALIALALAEDLGPGDITSSALIAEAALASATFVAREELVLAGLDVVAEVCRQVSAELQFSPLVIEGAKVGRGAKLATLSGPARAILAAERTALNFLQRLSGVATVTRRIVELTSGSGLKVLDTRKTTPGARSLEKQAVLAGGGSNHRVGLFDAVLIKNNHLDAFGGTAEEAVRAARAAVASGTKVEIEVRNQEELRSALKGEPDAVLLDNMNPAEVRECVALVRAVPGGMKIEIEVSGGINAENIGEYAGTGIDSVSLGALTHSARAVDISLWIAIEQCKA